MPKISRKSIEEIRQRVNLVDLASTYTQLKQAGTQFRGLSPFNSEKTPSFYVHPAKNVFMDYSSGNAGDLFRFMQLKENLDFNEAIEVIARRYNITLEYEQGSGASAEATSLRTELFAIQELAADYFHHCFNEQDTNAQAMREYWENGRHFPLELAAEFKIGFSPTEPYALCKVIQNKGFSAEAINQCGLVYANKGASQARQSRSRFRGRLMIPIRDVQGRVIAFTARQTDLTPQDDASYEAKYINSPETPIFSKGKILFGLDKARQAIKDKETFIMVEGQLDCLRAFQFGFQATVAPQGTAVTADQLHLINRYTHSIDCILDGDSAGKKAALRIMPIALKCGLEINFVNLPQNSDPDDFLYTHGAEAFEKLRQKRLSAVKCAYSHLLPEATKASPREKSEAINQIFNILVECNSAIAREGYLNELSQISNINPSTLQKDYSSWHRQRGNYHEHKQETPIDTDFSTPKKISSVESELIGLIINCPHIADALADTIEFEWINDSSLEGKLLNRFLLAIAEKEWPNDGRFDDFVETDEERNWVYTIISKDLGDIDPVDAANECIKCVFEKFISSKKKELDKSILDSPNADPQTKRDFFTQRQQLRELAAHPPELPSTNT